MVSAELCLEFVDFVSRERIKALLNEIAAKTGVKWIESSQNFMMSGTFKQVEESRAYLQRGANQSYGVVVFSDPKRKVRMMMMMMMIMMIMNNLINLLPLFSIKIFKCALHRIKKKLIKTAPQKR